MVEKLRWPSTCMGGVVLNLATETAVRLAPDQGPGEPSHEETADLLKAYMRINDPFLRELIVDLVERLAVESS